MSILRWSGPMTPVRAVVLVVLILGLLGSALVWGFRYAMDNAPGYRAPLIERLERELNAAVEVRVLALGWDGGGPALELQELELRGLGDEPLRARQLQVGLSIWSLLRGQIRPRRLTLDGLELTAQQRDGRWGIASLPQRGTAEAGNDAPLAALDGFDRIRIRNAELRFETADSTLGVPPVIIEEARLLRQSGENSLHVRLRSEPTDGGSRGALELTLELDRSLQPQHVRIQARAWDLSAFAALDERLAILNAYGGVQLQQINGHLVRQGGSGRAANGASAWHFEASTQWQIRAPQESSVVAPVVLAATMQGQVDARGVRLDVPELSVRGASGSWPEQQVWVEYRPQTPTPWRVQLGWLNLADIWPLAQPHWPAEYPLADPEGVIRDLSVQVRRAGQWPDAVFQLSGVGGRWGDPGVDVRGLEGEWSSSGPRGRLVINAHDLALAWPQALVAPLAIETLSGTIDAAWSEDGGWQFELPDLAYSLAGIDGVGRVSGEPQGRWSTDLRFLAPDVRGAVALIPAFWPASLQSWLSNAAQAGELRDGRVRLAGAGARVRRTEVDLDLSAVELRFAPGWSHVRAPEAQLRIRDQQLDVFVPQGRLQDIPARDVRASKRLNSPEPLTVQAQIAAPAERVMRTLRESPVGSQLRQVNAALSLAGPIEGQLDLRIGLGARQDVRWSTNIALLGVDMTLRDWPSPLQQLRGQIRLGPDGIAGDDLTAVMNEWPVRLASRRENGRSTIRARATVRVDRLPRDWPLPDWLQERLSGQADVVLEAEVGGSAAPLIRLRSDLQGTAVALPPPLAKTESAARLLTLEFDTGPSRMHLRYGEELALAAEDLGEDTQRMNLRLGPGAATVPPAAGIWVDGRLPPVHLEPWLDLVASIRGRDTRTATAAVAAVTADAAVDVFGGLSLDVDALQVAGQRWPDVGLQVLRSGDSWLVNTRGPDIQGQLLIADKGAVSAADDPPGPAALAIAGQFERVLWRLGRGDTSSAQPSPLRVPAALPSMDIRVSRFLVDNEELGPLSLAVVAQPGGYRVDSLQIGPDAQPTLTLSGVIAEPAPAPGTTTTTRRGEGDGIAVPDPEFLRPQRTPTPADAPAAPTNSLRFRWQDTNAEVVLRALGYGQQLQADRADVEGEMRWSSAEDLAQRRFDGDVRFRFADGRLLTVDPGAGRVLGLLSVTSLPRRFLLDFSDVTDAGLRFDSLEGSYRVQAGQARTDDLKIVTPSLRIETRGSVDLVAQTQDQNVRILPGISHGFTAAATVLGGPAMGLFMLFAQELLDKPLDQVGQISYRIHGPLDNPQVEAQP
ncbi:MAG: AsmA-like C-terminal region-containing protein [Oceanococcaceae bacterium]